MEKVKHDHRVLRQASYTSQRYLFLMCGGSLIIEEPYLARTLADFELKNVLEDRVDKLENLVLE